MKGILILIISILSFNVFASTLTQTVTAPIHYAADIFGSSEVTVINNVDVILVVGDVGATIDPDNAASITFTLANAKFGSIVSLNDLTIDGDGSAIMSHVSGGAIGDNAVTFSVVVQNQLEEGDRLTFSVGDLTAVTALVNIEETVTITTTIVVDTISGTESWPTNIILDDVDQDEIATTALGLDLPEFQTQGENGDVDLDDRTVLIAGTLIDHDNDINTDDVAALLLGGLIAPVHSPFPPVNALLVDFNYISGPANGVWDVVITGTFNAGDIVCIGVPCDETLTIVNTGVATGSIALSKTETSFYYIPGGDSDLTPTDFLLTGNVNFDEDTYVVLYGAQYAASSIGYAGIDSDGWSLGIPSSKSADMTFIRVTNETDSDVLIFGQGYGQDGADLGFVELVTLAGRETGILTSADLETAFGTWEGRARIDFQSTGNISVQTMIRSGGILNNMTGSAGMGHDGEQIIR